MGNVTLCSFPGGAFEKRKVNFKGNVIASGFFDDIHIADCTSLPVNFLRRHETFMRTTVRGFDEYLELTRDAPDRMLSFQNVFVESHHFRMDLSHRLGLCEDDSHFKTS